MLRRTPKSNSTLDQTKQDLARKESELRDRMERLERMIAEAPKVAEELTRHQREELLFRASEERSRLDVSVALHDKRYGDDGRAMPPRRALRKERRDGRIVFLLLIIALMATVIWLVAHFRTF
jgi:septal ring factor EnvC (AmiA/AmiB activator)